MFDDISMKQMINTPVTDLSDQDISFELGDIRLALSFPHLFETSTIDAVKQRMVQLTSEASLRRQMVELVNPFVVGDMVVTVDYQRGWPTAGCAAPPIGLKGIVQGTSPCPGKLTVKVDLRDMGYESYYDEEDNFKELYLWTNTLRKI